jgi:hypothetical protein
MGRLKMGRNKMGGTGAKMGGGRKGVKTGELSEWGVGGWGG